MMALKYTFPQIRRLSDLLWRTPTGTSVIGTKDVENL